MLEVNRKTAIVTIYGFSSFTFPVVKNGDTVLSPISTIEGDGGTSILKVYRVSTSNGTVGYEDSKQSGVKVPTIPGMNVAIHGGGYVDNVTDTIQVKCGMAIQVI